MLPRRRHGEEVQEWTLSKVHSCTPAWRSSLAMDDTTLSARYAVVLRPLFSATSSMKLILAVIQPTKLEAVRQALSRMGVTRMSVGDAMGFARQRGQTESYRGAEYETNLLRKVQLEIAVNDDFVERAIDCLRQTARTSTEGSIGDGKILVLPMDEAVQINDAQRGPSAI